jgi:hypothetical protein
MIKKEVKKETKEKKVKIKKDLDELELYVNNLLKKVNKLSNNETFHELPVVTTMCIHCRTNLYVRPQYINSTHELVYCAHCIKN